jgi:hypothetical protein
MSNDNDGLYATAEAFVYVAMTRPMVFFQAFHVAIAVEMLLAASTTWGFVLGKSISESRRADSNRPPAHYEFACGYPDAYHYVPVRGLPKPNTRPR